MEPLDMTETTRIANVPMKEMVFGAPRPRRVRLPFRLIFVAACLSAIGCVTARPAAEAPETVGVLSASYHSVAVAPVKHDAPPELGGVAGSDEDVPAATSLDVLRGEAAASGAVDVAAKDDGVTVGGVR